MARDYHAEYERRNELAEEYGFDSYAEQRRVVNEVNQYDEFVDGYGGEASGRDHESLHAASVYYDAFLDSETAFHKETGGAFYEWLVEITEQYTPEEYADLYGE